MAQVNIRLDDVLKEQAEELFHALGMSFSTAVSIFISQAVREGGLPFTVTTNGELFHRTSSMAVLRQSILDAGKLKAHELIEE